MYVRPSEVNSPLDYNLMKVGVKTVEDITLSLGSINKVDKAVFNKHTIYRALIQKDYATLRHISDCYYRLNGIYMRACNYLAQLYRYDWYVVAETGEGSKKEEVVKRYTKILDYLDNSDVKAACAEIALKVVRYGCYYGYPVPCKDRLIIQELPAKYCRSRYKIGGDPAVEFNMAFFDECFPDIIYRNKILKMFPEEFQIGYNLYKRGKLKKDFATDCGGWYLLESNVVKFNLNDSDIPILANTIPHLMDLDAAQDLDRRKQMQQLQKILVQKLPTDKNGDLLFDIDEARDIHNTTVDMLRKAVGVDVITTFADVEAVNISDKNTTATQDDLSKMERQVYNSMGLSYNLFNTTGNLALEKSILNDEAMMRDLLLQFSNFFDKITREQNKRNEKFRFRLYMLETTQSNYKEMAKTYKEQVQLGYSKMLPQVALGQAQSSIVNMIYFENEILGLSEIMIPPQMSSTISRDDILNKKTSTSSSSSSGETGRPEKSDDEKSEKTIANKESMS